MSGAPPASDGALSPASPFQQPSHQLDAGGATLGGLMQVRDGMTATVLVVGPGHTLRQTAKLMRERKVGAAVVHDDDGQGPSILTERDILESVALGQDPDVEVAGDHLTTNAVVAAPEWSLDDAASAMLRGGFRHLIVSDGGAVIGVLSMRDIVGCWSRARQPA